MNLNVTNVSLGNHSVSTLSTSAYSPPAGLTGERDRERERERQRQQGQTPCIAVHCIAGLGRAPVLIAIALIEYGFGDTDRVVDFIRKRRKNAINMRQLQHLQDY